MNPHVTAIYCDDFREEKSGKLIVIGMYNSVMNLTLSDEEKEKSSAALPTFAILTQFNSPTRQNLPNEIYFTVYNTDGTVVARTGGFLPEEVIAQAKAIDPDATVISVGAQIQIAPLRVPKPGRIRVEATIDGEVLKAPSLRVNFLHHPRSHAGVQWTPEKEKPAS